MSAYKPDGPATGYWSGGAYGAAGGGPALPLPDPSYVRFGSLADFQRLFPRQANSLWAERPVGSTPSADTGPGTNTCGPYVFIETSGTSPGSSVETATRTSVNKAAPEWRAFTGSRRRLHFRACLQGTVDGGNAWGTSEGLFIEAREGAGAWNRIALIPGAAWGNYTAGDQISLSGGVSGTCVQDGGWLDWEVPFPDEADDMRMSLAYITGSGTHEHDVALWRWSFTPGVTIMPGV